ncbi:hypothetical protein POM88_016997 [Heracleum sosnowskyi]|uniref:Ubiquitin-like protease family profile domain-containing protein n=1 Tax=Heracleum sosnowskyi TaxID=360622 RepID=A0AAD8MXL9_9APIA|nr:hypothetical protein POM88_016997 [Heracleum sosnowskyi]
MEMDMQELSVPSFSLGTDLQNFVIDICKDISREHGDDTIVEQESDKNTTITPMSQQLIREKRETKVTAAYRSPYVQREIDINTKYSTQEYAVWRWIIQKGKDDVEHVFNYGEQYCIREHMATLRPGEKIYTSVGLLDNSKSEEDQYERFGVEMNHFFKKNPDKKIEDHNLIFFPIFQDEHYYLVCINLKKASFEVIDNIRVGKAGNKEYGRYARKLVSICTCLVLMNISLIMYAQSYNELIKVSCIYIVYRPLNNCPGRSSEVFMQQDRNE